MSKAPGPTPQDIEELLAFLPVFRSPDFRPVAQVHDGRGADGARQFTWPEYKSEIVRFIQVTSKDCWQDRHYSPEAMAVMIADSQQVASATLDEVRSMLTYCVRGERFCDGYIGHMIESGRLAQILERLRQIADRQRPQEGTR